MGTIHASCVLLDGAGAPFGAPADAGVLLLGESGSGKSDLALRLIERGAVLVADDRTELFTESGWLCARAPANVAGLIEVRNVGVIELPHAGAATITLAVQLSTKEAPQRLPHSGHYVPGDICLSPDRLPPLLHLAAREASAPVKVIVAAAAHAKALFRERCKPI